MNRESNTRVTVRPWARWLFRVAITLEALLAFAQPVLAGGFLSGDYDMLQFHKLNATYTGYAAMFVAVAGILLWKPGRGPGWIALIGVLQLVVVLVQYTLGFGHVLLLHIPLGVAIVGGLVPLLIWSWRSPDRARPVQVQS